jgi:hypothetical protein
MVGSNRLGSVLPDPITELFLPVAPAARWFMHRRSASDWIAISVIIAQIGLQDHYLQEITTPPVYFR